MNFSLIHPGVVLLLSVGLSLSPALGDLADAGDEAGRATAGAAAATLPPEALEEARQYLSLLAGSRGADEEALLNRSGASLSLSPRRREQWRAFAGEMRDWLKDRKRDERGQLTLEVTDSRTEGDLAAFVAYLFDERQPLDLGVLPVMMYREKGRWLVAPFLTDFGNTRLPFEKNIRQKSRELSQWAAERSRTRLEEGGGKVERKTADILKSLRKKNRWDEAAPQKLLMDWVAALRTGNALALAALGEMEGSQPSSWSGRLRDALSFIPTKERSIWEFRLSFFVGGDSSLVIPLPAKESSEDRMDLGVINFNEIPGTPAAVSLLSFQVKDSPGGGGRTLFYPRAFSPAMQKEYDTANNMGEKESMELTQTILARFSEGMVEKKYATPEEFAQAYTDCVFGDGAAPGVAEFLTLRGRDGIRGAEAVARAGSKWRDMAYEWAYQKRMRERYPDWDKVKKKFSRLVKIDENRTAFVLFLTGPKMLWGSTASHFVTIERRGDSWGWGEDVDSWRGDNGQLTHNKLLLRLKNEVLNHLGKQVMKDVETIKWAQLPSLPDKIESLITGEPDDELKRWMEQTFGGNGLYDFFDKPFGVRMEGERDDYAHYQQYEDLKNTDDGRCVRETAFEWKAGAPPGRRTILTALQSGDWAMLGIFLRKEPEYMVALPVVKVDGKWQPLVGGIYCTLRNNEGYVHKVAWKRWRNKFKFYGKMSDLYMGMAMKLADKRLLPEEVYKNGGHGG